MFKVKTYMEKLPLSFVFIPFIVPNHRTWSLVDMLDVLNGIMLEIWCNMLSLMATYLMKLFLIETYWMSCLLIRNLCVKDVKMMILQVSSDVTQKGIPVSATETKQEIFLNVYISFMKVTHVWM